MRDECLEIIQRTDSNGRHSALRKVIQTKRRHKSKPNALKTPCLAKHHREAYNDFRLFSRSLGTEYVLTECHVFRRSLTLPPIQPTAAQMVGKYVNGKCYAILCLSNIITIVANINSGEWLMFKIESHLPRFPTSSPTFHWRRTNNNEENAILFFNQMRIDESLYQR